MGHLIGYMANRADRMGDALYQERAAIVHEAPPPNARSWGIGFYQGDEVLHKKRPMKAGDRIDWEQIAGDVRSDCAVMHVRQPSVGDFRPENAHPFRFRRWTFAHRGTIVAFDDIRERLSESLPDFLRRNIRGQTDSEYLFHAILSFVHDAGQLDNIDNIDVADDHVLTAMSLAIALVTRLSAEVGHSQNTLTSILTNGRSMFALCDNTNLAYVEREGLHETRDDYTPPPKGSTRLRFAMIVSSDDDCPSDFTAVETGQVITVNRNLKTSIHSL